jgi:hypothetical protein
VCVCVRVCLRSRVCMCVCVCVCVDTVVEGGGVRTCKSACKHAFGAWCVGRSGTRGACDRARGGGGGGCPQTRLKNA